MRNDDIGTQKRYAWHTVVNKQLSTKMLTLFARVKFLAATAGAQIYLHFQWLCLTYFPNQHVHEHTDFFGSLDIISSSISVFLPLFTLVYTPFHYLWLPKSFSTLTLLLLNFFLQ